MASIHAAIAFVIVLEDDHRFPGVITALRGDAGGKTRLGIAERFHPQLSARGFYVGEPISGVNPRRWTPTQISVSAGGGIAEETYATEYAAPLLLDQIESQDLANELLSFAVNAGKHQAVATLQQALGIVADGAMGDKTLAAANASSQALVLFKQAREHFYQHIVANNPALASMAKGLLARANA